MSTEAAQQESAVGLRKAWPVVALAFVIAVVSQLIGSFTIKLGVGSIIILPMVWGIIMGAVVSIQKLKPLGLDLQKIANALVGVAVLLLIARLAFNIGPTLPTLLKAGPALLLQEIGHLLGTIALALPLAVLLKMGKSAVGAAFSLDREPAFAIVGEKHGPDSDQYRGVLAMYVFGTLFGAVYITLLSSLVASAGIFDPIAMAMGAGVGSGSMMAASAGSIIAAFPAQEKQILAMAAVSNLITTVLGVYVGIYIALPLADRFYRFLTRHKAEEEEVVDVATAEENRRIRQQATEAAVQVKLPVWLTMSVLSIIGIATASVAAKGISWQIVGGYAIMVGLILLSMFLAKVSRKISAIVWATTLGALISSPWSPIGETLAGLVTSVNFLSIATVVLVCAGLSLGKDIPLLKNIGWKIIPVGLVAITASFVLATVIAEFTLGFWS